MELKNKIQEVLALVKDPEIGLGVIDLGLIYDIDINDNNDVDIRMTLTTPACPCGPEIIDAVRISAQKIEEVKEVNVEVVFDPPWNPEEMASEYARDVLGIW